MNTEQPLSSSSHGHLSAKELSEGFKPFFDRLLEKELKTEQAEILMEIARMQPLTN